MYWEKLTMELNQINDPKEHYRFALDEFKAARQRASLTVKNDLSAREISNVFAAGRMGIDVGGFGRQLKGNFALPPESLVTLCNDLLLKSVTQVMFGDRGETKLTRSLSVALEPLENEDDATRNRIVKYAQALRSEAARSQHLAQEMPFNDLLRDRILEIAQDMDVVPFNICGLNAEPAVRASIRNLIDRDNFCCSLNTLLYIAACNNTTIDALIAPNPVPFTMIRYYNKRRGRVIYNKEIRKLAELYYGLDEAYRRRLLVYLLNRSWEAKAS